ncbi:hemocytin [Plakobranchus ocellatus]|uniref:Hemocytin n=1 Tax=Plakobranchus ocellatus TaxID=259542 RepID=A0AAV3XXK7_9GAST|nr:hemocytin [Plakobranchus ocellatus]
MAYLVGQLAIKLDIRDCPTPPAPANGTVFCSANDGLALDINCLFTCNSGYKFQGVTETEYLFVCDIARGFYDTPSTPPCIPDCNPACLHGGTCIAPNKCQCVAPYYGDQCLHSRQLCNDPVPGRFGRMECQSDGNGGKICVPVCLPTFKFETPPPAQYVCGKDGTWSPDVTKIPDCVQEIDLQTTTTTKPAPSGR